MANAPEQPTTDTAFPCSITINIPFPTPRLALVAHKALSVDKELSPLVRRHFFTVANDEFENAEESVFRVEYRATTNRMLRVAVNSFMDSIALVLDVMENLDVEAIGGAPPEGEKT